MAPTIADLPIRVETRNLTPIDQGSMILLAGSSPARLAAATQSAIRGHNLKLWLHCETINRHRMPVVLLVS
jgi:hypothetical protein